MSSTTVTHVSSTNKANRGTAVGTLVLQDSINAAAKGSQSAEGQKRKRRRFRNHTVGFQFEDGREFARPAGRAADADGVAVGRVERQADLLVVRMRVERLAERKVRDGRKVAADSDLDRQVQEVAPRGSVTRGSLLMPFHRMSPS